MMKMIIEKLINYERIFFDKIDREKLKMVSISVLVFSMLANAYAYYNFNPQHDAINHMFKFAGEWEISLGRFWLPVYGKFRGAVDVPMIEGVLSILFITMIVYLIVKLLDFQEKWQMILISGILSANLCITETTTIFMYVLSAYVLSALFACLAAYLLSKCPKVHECLIAGVCIVFSLGLYQGEITFALVLLSFAVLRDAFRNYRFGELLKKWIPAFIVLICSAILYYCLCKFIWTVYNIVPPESDNSLAILSGMEVKSLLLSVLNVYSLFIKAFFSSDCFWGSAMCGVFNSVLFILAVILLVNCLITRKMYWYNKVIIVVCMAAFPGLACMMDIIMQESKLSYYILYAVFLFYVLLIFIIKECSVDLKETHYLEVIKRIMMVGLSVIIFQNIIFSNQTYTVQKIMYDRSVSIVGRILNEIEDYPEYDAGVTEIVLIGNLNKNKEIEKFAKSNVLRGGEKISVSYSRTFDSFCSLLGSPANVVFDKNISNEYKRKEEIKDMQAYPNGEYCRILDGRMVIKLSE